jgi:hypothetical protein
VFKERPQKEIEMKKNTFFQLSGWSLIAGAIVFLPGAIAMLLYDTQYTDTINLDSKVAVVAIFLSPILIAVGMMGLRARYGGGSGFLLFGAVVGGIVTLVGTFGQAFAPVYSVSEFYWLVWFIGVFILFFGLSLFGINALVDKPLPRWNALPLLSGVWFTLLPTGFFGIGKIVVDGLPIIAITGFILMTVAQIMLGYILQADAAPNIASA